MLVLARKPLFRNPGRALAPQELVLELGKLGHGVWIGDDIRVRVLSYSDGLVRLGIDAPHSVHVWRDELKVDR
jgi:carbon storage regulator CsrA